jgi:serine protease Do
LLPIDLKSKDSHGAKGTLCAAVGNSFEPTGFGVISSANRPLNGKSGAFLGLTVQPHDEGLRITEIKPTSPAIRAGIRLTDIILSAEGDKLATAEQLNERVAAMVPGDTLRIDLQREQAQLSVSVVLGDGTKLAPMPGNREQAFDSITAKLSKRRWFFATGLQHDCAIAAKDCGGPLIDIDGRMIGLNIARAGRIHSYAIPIDDVIRFVSAHNVRLCSKRCLTPFQTEPSNEDSR